MKPTMKLRLVERVRFIGTNQVCVVDEVLQQWWEDDSTDVYWVDGNPGEWRDVPVETEETK